MRNPFRPTENDDAIDAEIATVLARMNTHGPENPEYYLLLEKLERLNALKAENKPKRVSRDAIVSGVVHILGIAVLVFAEKDAIFPKMASSQIGRHNK